MRDAKDKAERKEELRRIFEPYWRQAVVEAESELFAWEQYVDRATLISLMLDRFPQSIVDCAARDGLNETTWEREDIELLKELADELIKQMIREALN